MDLPEIKTELKVERYRWVRRGREGYGYCEDQGEYQLLVKRWKLWGVTIWKQTLDREEIPMHVLIEIGCLGGTNWVSKFKDHMYPDSSKIITHENRIIDRCT